MLKAWVSAADGQLGLAKVLKGAGRQLLDPAHSEQEK